MDTSSALCDITFRWLYSTSCTSNARKLQPRVFWFGLNFNEVLYFAVKFKGEQSLSLTHTSSKGICVPKLATLSQRSPLCSTQACNISTLHALEWKCVFFSACEEKPSGQDRSLSLTHTSGCLSLPHAASFAKVI